MKCYIWKKRNISLGDKAICGLGVVVGITAVAAGSPHLIDLLKQVSPDSIFTPILMEWIWKYLFVEILNQ